MLGKSIIGGVIIGTSVLAVIDNSVWHSLIAAAAIAFATYIGLRKNMVDNQRAADERADARAAATEARMLQSQQEMQRESRERGIEQDRNILTVSAKVDKVDASTNGMSHRLEEAIKKEAFTRGTADEKARAATEKAAVDAGVKAAVTVTTTAPEKLVTQIKENKVNADNMADDLRGRQG